MTEQSKALDMLTDAQRLVGDARLVLQGIPESERPSAAISKLDSIDMEIGAVMGMVENT